MREAHSSLSFSAFTPRFILRFLMLDSSSFEMALAKHKEYKFKKGQRNELGRALKVIESSDVVQVQNDEEPQGTRCYDLEKHLKENCLHKDMVLLLYKCDLVTAWTTKRLIGILLKEYPTLAFHTSVAKSFGKVTPTLASHQLLIHCARTMYTEDMKVQRTQNKTFTEETIWILLCLFCERFSMFGSIITIDAMIGAITCGRIADFIERKGVIINATRRKEVFFKKKKAEEQKGSSWKNRVTMILRSYAAVGVTDGTDVIHAIHNAQYYSLDPTCIGYDMEPEKIVHKNTHRGGYLGFAALGILRGYHKSTAACEIGLAAGDYSIEPCTGHDMEPYGIFLMSITQQLQQVMRMSAVFCITKWLAVYFFMGTLVLDMARFLTGFGIGLFSLVVQVFIVVIAPKNLRGGLTAVTQWRPRCQPRLLKFRFYQLL
ncbi:hypothetical protein K7X08_009274 [Anisodus acutangulus]|uniref:Uncharacterized protein n=1 Tax=Anisodus acutangulus TaxID=402998 RepID=A0A9Q1MZJ4_9SOLA|nr:hypothetical protein K7X08_009274 [Anisodus acutangulus]